jgi:transcription elongation factor Elf1
MVNRTFGFHRVNTVGEDFVYQAATHFDPDQTVYCPHCWKRGQSKVALPPSGESGYAVCISCRTAIQLLMPCDLDVYYTLDD